MVFQAKTRGWRRFAARLLLVPVLAGGAAALATAQPPRPGTAMPAGGGDPKMMLKDGRRALSEGRFNDARDLAQRAEASNPTGKWGLFDDTPNALRRDVEAGQVKAKAVEVESLTKQAKALITRPAASDAEKARNLDQALQMARRAEQLHGPTYSVWELGDRPDRMVKDIESARARLSPATLPAAPVAGATKTPQPAGPMPVASKTGLPTVRPAVGTATPGAPSGVTTAAATGKGPAPVSPAVATAPKAPTGPAPTGPLSPVATGPTPPAMPTAPASPVTQTTDAKKATAQRLMADGKRLADGGEFAAAHAKFTEAGKVGAEFTGTEPNPGLALQELSARGAAAIDRLVREATTRTAGKDFAKAEAALDAAGEIAGALSLFGRPIEEAKTALRVASNGAHGGLPPGGLAPAGGPEALVRVPEPAAPMAPGTSVTGRQLIDQATLAFRQGDFDAARRIALQAHNVGGAQAEARGILNQIDAEVFAGKQRNASRSLDAAASSVQTKDHGHALGVLVLIDPNLLTAELKAKREELINVCKAALDRPVAGVVAIGGTQLPTPPTLPTPPSDAPPMGLPSPMLGNPPGVARIQPDATKGGAPENLAGQAEAMRKVAFQKLRSDGLKVQADAQAAFGRGETDLAIQMLTDYTTRVRAANLEPSGAALLLRPVDSRLEMFRVMKGQTDALARERNDRRETRELVTGRGAAEEQRKAEVQRLVRQYHSLVQRSDFAAAERVALQAKQLEPDDPAVAALAHMAKMTRRVREAQEIKDGKEQLFLSGINAAEKMGPFVDTENPVAVRIDASLKSRKRGSLDDSYQRTRTPGEYEIELKLDRQVSLDFLQTPLSEAVENVRALTGLPVSWDTDSITKAGVSTAMPVSERIGAISARNALSIILDHAKLSYVIEYDTVRITTTEKAKGRLYTKVFSVADLVTPVPNFALPDYANFEKMINKNALNSGNVVMPGLTGPAGPANVRGGLGNGAQVGSQATSAGTTGTVLGNERGTLQNEPLYGSAGNASAGVTREDQLMRLIKSLVRPHTWDGPAGGPGKVEYFDIGHALVVNQTADVIREIDDLLSSLRQLQDLAVAVEIRIISLSETWFERMGVDFSMNIKTHNTRFEPQLTTNQFRPEPFINDINNKGVTVGLSPAGSFTNDLDVPIRSTSFNYAIPGFGGYPNNPGANGGLSLGLAFLNDIQVFMFMEAAQGDRRVNVMQAPKITLFNGQTANLAVQETQFAVTNVSVFAVNGQIVFVPQNNLVPGAQVQDPTGQIGLANVAISVQAVVSADRRFVRLNLPITMAAQTGATIPLFPITTFITPIFEGGSQGQPIPFTQFLQQPAFTTMAVQTTVVCPDGGTVLLGGLKTLGESRNEFGPPFLSKVPYLNRLFKNVGIGRETRHIMIMVTPRIIINAEEEYTQTEAGGPLGSRP